MNHIDEIRIMELALGLGKPTTEESCHLSECEMCTALLREEIALTASLQDIPTRQVPAGFSKKAQAGFQKALSASSKFTPFFVVGIIAAVLLTSAMLWIILANPATFTSNAAMAFAKFIVFFKAMFIAVDHLPFAKEAIMISSLAIMLMSTLLLLGFAKKTQAAVK